MRVHHRHSRLSEAGHAVAAREPPSLPQAGLSITALTGLRNGSGPLGLGRVACFAVRRGIRRWTDPVLLTSHHVLSAHGAGAGAAVHVVDPGPSNTSLRIDTDGSAPIAEVTGEGCDGIHRYAFDGEPACDYHLDAATATLTDTSAVPSGDEVFTVGRVHPHDAIPNRSLPVRLLGVHRSVAGRVVDTNATAERADGTRCPGTILIRTLPGRPPFATEGDSGALVVDNHDRAVGMLWGVHLNEPDLAFACHLLPVLDRLDLVPSQRFGVTTLREEP